jgi:septal ring factor EnvC (AmiA/AmiB activator)
MAETSKFDEARLLIDRAVQLMHEEIDRIENIDATIKKKKQAVDSLTASERDLSARVKSLQDNHTGLSRSVAETTDELQNVRETLKAMKDSARKALGL